MDKRTEIKREVKVGQIYREKQLPTWRKYDCDTFVITHINHQSTNVVYKDGTTDYIGKYFIDNDCEFIAEYTTWREAVNSKEFRNE